MTHLVPLGFGQWLQALSYALSKPREIAIIGEPESADTQTLLSVVRSGYQPFQAVALGAPDAQSPEVPLLQDRSNDGWARRRLCVPLFQQSGTGHRSETLRMRLE